MAGQIDDLDHNRELRNEKWYGTPTKLGIAGQMVRDAHVAKAIEAIRDPLEGAHWDFQPASDDPADVEAADFCRWVFFERTSWSHTLQRITNYVRDGFSLLEVEEDAAKLPTKRFPLHPGRGLGIVFSHFHERPAWSVNRWVQSSTNPVQVAGVEQWIQGSDEEEAGFPVIPGDQLIRFSWDQEGANFAGLAPLRGAYGPWKAKILLQIVDFIRHEREGAGIPRIALPQGATEADEDRATLILSEMRANEKGYLLLPFGFEFAWETTKGLSTGIGEALERCNRDIAYRFGIAWNLFGGSGNGSWALATEQRGQYALSLEKHARFVETAFNIGADGWSAVERLVRLNYGDKVGVPRLVARNMPTRDWTKILPIVYQLGLSGFLTADSTLEEFIRSVLYMPHADPKTARPRDNAQAAVGQNEKREPDPNALNGLLEEMRGVRAELVTELAALLREQVPQLANQVTEQIARILTEKAKAKA